MSTYTGSTVQSTPRTVLLCLQLTKGEAAKPQDKAQAPPRASTTFWKRLHLTTWSINRIFALEPWKSMNIIFCPILQDGRAFIIWDHPWISIFSPPMGNWVGGHKHHVVTKRKSDLTIVRHLYRNNRTVQFLFQEDHNCKTVHMKEFMNNIYNRKQLVP